MKRIIVFALFLSLFCALAVSANATAAEPLTAEFYNGTPVVDGEIEALWDSVPAYNVNFGVQPDLVTLIDKSQFGIDAYFKGMWDDKYIYILAYVSDKTLNTEQTEKDSWAAGQFWQVDSQHFFFDLAGGGALDFKLEVMAYGQDRGNFSQFGGAYKYEFRTGSDYYYIEAQIEAGAIAPGFKMADGTTFRIDYQVNNNNNGDTGTREECYIWNDETYKSNGSAALCGIGKLVAAKAAVPEPETEAPETEAAEAAQTPATDASAAVAAQTSDITSFVTLFAGIASLTAFAVSNRKHR